ncbi:hypothetical protein PGQ11_007857 [Apiospora arundinis]|uniref:DUF7168 domain-containing protein n=1 Tax=Apiospora arundinis TaxID=335852 RepID=A0ABR2IWQ8_9PEZI
MDSAKADLRRTLDDLEEPENPPRKRPTRSRAPPNKLSPVLYKASAKELAEADTIRTSSSTADIDDAIILRIKKCLDCANYLTRWRQRLKQHFAEVLAHEPDEQRHYAGQSVVSISRCDGDRSRSVRQQSYTATLAHAMGCFFDCKHYSTGYTSSVDFTFYGIAENSIAAAMSFEMAYNLIAEWARPFKGVGSKNSYCHGICDELVKTAANEKASEELRAKKAESDAIAAKAREEEAERAARLARLAEPLRSPSSTPEPGPPLKAEPRDHTDCGREKSPEAASSATALSDGGNIVNYEQDCAHDDSVLFNPEEADNTVWEDFRVPDFDTKDEQRLDLFGGLDKEIKNLIKAESPSSEAFLDDKELLLPYSALLLPPQDNHSHQTPSYKLETSPPLLGEGKIPPPELSDNMEILESKWASHGQLVTFRKTATKIAED